MMAFKLISLLVVACILSQTQGATTSKKSSLKGERIAALYVKDGSNGELRFLGGAGLGSTANQNAQLNQYITQKQNMLEQLRPTTGTAATNIFGTATGTGTALTGSGFGTSTSGLGVSPIIVNAGGTTATNANSGINSAIINGSPVAGILPDIVAQAVFSRRGPNNNNRRRVVNNRRRGVNNRRRGGNNKNKPHVYVVRPKH